MEIEIEIEISKMGTLPGGIPVSCGRHTCNDYNAWELSKSLYSCSLGFQGKLGGGRIRALVRWLDFKLRMPWAKQRRAFPGRENSEDKGMELYSEKNKFYLAKTKSLGRRGKYRRGN